MKYRPQHQHDLHPMSLMAFVLSLISLALVTSMLFIPKQDSVYLIFLGVDTFICLLFWCQLLTDFIRSEEKTNYLKRHWPDFMASIPVIEPFRFARLVQVFRVVRLLRSSKHIMQQLQENRREATIATICLLLTVLITIGSSFILLIEAKDPNANIHSASDALWWVIVTISTVGYGDHYPVTTLGKVLGTMVIVCGVGVFGMISGLVSSIITDPQHQKEQQEKEHRQEWRQMLANQQALLQRLERIEKHMAEQEESDKKNAPDNL
ncbi:ion transporter [Photobacterium damselae]